MKTIEINSTITLGKGLPTFSEAHIKYEPMLFGCDLPTAFTIGGEPTIAFLKALPKSWLRDPSLIIDSRVHMLMPGWYPCIPGFHHDDVPREREDGQPEYNNPSYRSKHALALYNGDICPTEFALGVGQFAEPPLGETTYKHWHKDVENSNLERIKAPSEQVVFFDDRTWHQCVPAVKNGWRLFLRASIGTTRKHTNEERRQVQVYLENPMEGW